MRKKVKVDKNNAHYNYSEAITTILTTVSSRDSRVWGLIEISLTGIRQKDTRSLEQSSSMYI